jgi:hypothetical protein
MRIPREALQLPGGLSCVVAEVEPRVTSAHVVRHPLGVDAERDRVGSAWDREGWGELAPAAISNEARTRLFRTLASLSVHGAGCGVPEVSGARDIRDQQQIECSACPTPLARRCETELHDVVDVYVARTTELLEDLATSSVWVPRLAMIRVLAGRLRTAEPWTPLATLSVGFDARTRERPIARVSRTDGLRTELYLHGASLRWRTTWRSVPSNGAEAMSFVLQFPKPLDSSHALSDRCLVARPWWERHGTR